LRLWLRWCLWLRELPREQLSGRHIRSSTRCFLTLASHPTLHRLYAVLRCMEKIHWDICTEKKIGIFENLARRPVFFISRVVLLARRQKRAMASSSSPSSVAGSPPTGSCCCGGSAELFSAAGGRCAGAEAARFLPPPRIGPGITCVSERVKHTAEW